MRFSFALIEKQRLTGMPDSQPEIRVDISASIENVDVSRNVEGSLTEICPYGQV